MACGRPVLVSDRVGCAADVVDASCGRIFPFDNSQELVRALIEMLADRNRLREAGRNARLRAWSFDIASSENSLVATIFRTLVR